MTTLLAEVFSSDQSPISARPAPPDPQMAQSVLDFVVCLRQLKEWSGKSLRQLHQDALKHDDWNLPRSSLSDALDLRKPRLARPELLRAMTIAAGLSPAQCESWLTVRARLAGPPRETDRPEQRSNTAWLCNPAAPPSVDQSDNTLPVSGLVSRRSSTTL